MNPAGTAAAGRVTSAPVRKSSRYLELALTALVAGLACVGLSWSRGSTGTMMWSTTLADVESQAVAGVVALCLPGAETPGAAFNASVVVLAASSIVAGAESRAATAVWCAAGSVIVFVADAPAVTQRDAVGGACAVARVVTPAEVACLGLSDASGAAGAGTFGLRRHNLRGVGAHAARFFFARCLAPRATRTAPPPIHPHH